MAGKAFILLLLAAVTDAALPPGYEDELFCAKGWCLRKKPPRQDGMVGGKNLYWECFNPASGKVDGFKAWGSHRGDEAKEALQIDGFHSSMCSEPGAAIALGGVTGGMAFELAGALLAGIVALAFFVRHLRAQKKLDPDTSHSFRILDRREVTSDSADRSYTPTRFDGNQCELLFRVYPEGKMTRHLYNLKVGDEVQIRGPTGIHRYGLDGPGTFRELRKRMKATRVGLVAGGTGITPMLQIANAVLQDPDDNTPLELIAFNSTPDDVMLYNRLNTIAQESDGQLKLNWVVSRERKQQPASLEEAPYPWPAMTDTHFFGRVSQDVLKLHLPPPAEDTIICLCGPPAFNKAAKSALAELDHKNVLTW